MSKAHQKGYFESMSQFYGLSLHTGGLKRTCDLLISAKLSPGESILEVGSGTGGSSRLILEAGFNLTCVDPNKNLLDSAVAYCAASIGTVPKAINAKIEETEFTESSFDCALMECVFGFIEHKKTALKKIHRALKNGRFLCVNDFYYHTEPDEDSLKELNAITGGYISPMRKLDYLQLFKEQGFICFSWEDIPKVKNELFKQSDLNGMSQEERNKFSEFSASWIEVFERNKRNTNAFLSLWMKVENK